MKDISILYLKMLNFVFQIIPIIIEINRNNSKIHNYLYREL